MTRLVLALFVGFAVQGSALTAPFVHLHPQERHDGSHHEAPRVHRHLAPHTEAGGHHHDDHDADPADRDDATAVTSSDAISAIAIGTMSARPAVPALSLAPAVSVAALTPPLDCAVAPDHDVGPRLPPQPDPGHSSLRGPPR